MDIADSANSEGLVGIDEDLYHANARLQQLQGQVIEAYEACDIAAAQGLEEELDAATVARDALVETKEYMVNKQRLQDCSGRLSSVMYLSEMSPQLSQDENALQKIVFHANAKNEMAGITGVLYVLRGFFASYLEGPETAIDRLLRKLKVDSRHCRFRIVSRTQEVPNAVRKYPNNGLAVKHLETPQTVSQQHPEATMLHELSTHLKLQAFVPLLDGVLRGRQLTTPFQPVTIPRILIMLKPLAEFFTFVPDVGDRVSLVERVMARVKFHCEGRNNSTAQGAIVGPHSCDNVVACFTSEVPGEVLDRVVALFKDIVADSVTRLYCPTIALHYGDVVSVMNGAVSVVGPALRMLRLHAEFGQHRYCPVTISEQLAEALQLVGCSELETTEFIPRRPVDVYAASELRYSFSWPEEMARIKEDIIVATSAQAANAAGNDAAVCGTNSSPPPNGSRSPFPTSKKRLSFATSDDETKKPVKGLPSEADMREIFESLRVEPNGMILRSNFDAWLHTQENAGVPVYNSEVDRVMQQYSATLELEYVTFEQFCMIAYHRLC